MKLSTYHKLRGDYVAFVKGCDPLRRATQWDRVYVSTVFTYHWATVVKTIQYYRGSVPAASDIVVGGVMATLMADDIEQSLGARVIRGLLDMPGMLDPGDGRVVDSEVPDYGLVDAASSHWAVSDAYITYATRGCPNRCTFCAVHRIEPHFVHYLPLRRQIQMIDDLYGPRRDLLLLDNNVLASDQFDRIVDDIVCCGFHRGAKLKNRLRRADFNQGVDMRLLSEHHTDQLFRTAIDPLRLAFDHPGLAGLYRSKVRMAWNSGIRQISTYVLYNYLDTPDEFYDRLRTTAELNEELGSQVYSFPMRYVPLDARDRSHVGPHWNRRLLRGVRCILIATRGLVGTKLGFFEAAFGADAEAFTEIILMPDDYIIHRQKHGSGGADDWRRQYRRLRPDERTYLKDLLGSAEHLHEELDKGHPRRIRELLAHHVEAQRNQHDVPPVEGATKQ